MISLLILNVSERVFPLLPVALYQYQRKTESSRILELRMIISLIIKVNNNKTNYHLHLHIGLLLGKYGQKQRGGYLQIRPEAMQTRMLI